MTFLKGRNYFRRVLGLFLAAALVPVAALSVVLTGIASGSLERASEERGRTAAASFSRSFGSLVDGMDRSLSLISVSPEAVVALAAGNPEEAGLSRLIAREASREGGLAFGLVSADGSRSYATRMMPRDWDPRVYGSWGVFRRAAAESGSAFVARRRITENGEAALIVAARSIRGDDGRLLGFALAELDRAGLIRAARSSGADIAADYELTAPSGLVAFSLSDSSREGRFLDELPRRGGRTGRVSPASGSGRGYAEYGASSARGFFSRAYVPESFLSELTSAMRSATYAGLAVCAAVALALAFIASRIVSEPVLALSAAMGRLRDGDLSVRLQPRSEDELGALVRSFNETAAELERLMRETLEDQELLRGAELRALAARMNPHFLYNSLNSIRSLAKLGRNEEIVEVAARLGKLLRASADSRADVSTIGAGMESVRHYLAVERIRFGERFSFEERIDPELEACELPCLVLEPLAENALTHGLERKAGPGFLRIEGRIDGTAADETRAAVISFEDDGPGTDPGFLAEISARLETASVPGDGNGLGLAATNRRLRLRYGTPYGLSVSAGTGGNGFRVELRVPYRRNA